MGGCSSRSSGNGQSRMTRVVEHRPTTTTALIRQAMRHHRPDYVLPGTGRRHGSCLVRCFSSQSGIAKQKLAEAGSPNASRSKGDEPKTLIERRKRAAGIEPASSAWKAEVLPLNYARVEDATTHHEVADLTVWTVSHGKGNPAPSSSMMAC
jgi:hypothetical protein